VIDQGTVIDETSVIDHGTGIEEGTEPIIVGATLAAGHDGEAEAVIEILYPNGAVRSVTFTCDALSGILDQSGVDSLDGLRGMPWTILVETPPIDQNTH
jgi:hypothetical protein